MNDKKIFQGVLNFELSIRHLCDIRTCKIITRCECGRLVESTPSERLYLSVITIGEVRKGLTKLPDSKKKDQLTNWLNTLLEDYQNRIYSINLTVAENWGVIQGKAEKKGTPMSSIDSLIAAIAYTYNLVLVPGNVRDFEAGNLPIQNPWVA